MAQHMVHGGQRPAGGHVSSSITWVPGLNSVVNRGLYPLCHLSSSQLFISVTFYSIFLDPSTLKILNEHL